jgi:TonB family protein
MKTNFLIFTLLFTLLAATFSANAQDKKPPETTVFYKVEEMPEFPGGQLALKEFISQSVKYPEDARKNGIQGRVYVQFVVSKDGTVQNATIVRGVDPLLDNEALRVVNTMPAWKPGKQKGEAVDVSFTVPVAFALSDDKPIEGNLKVKFMDNKLQLTGPADLIDKMRPYMQDAKPLTTFSMETGSFTFAASGDTPDDPVFFMVEEMPEYPGGEEALREFISTAVKYPEEAHRDSIQGKVFVSFTIAKDGLVKDAKVVRGVHPTLDNESLRVVNMLPRWTPGKQRNQAVNVQYTIPVNFVLQ